MVAGLQPGGAEQLREAVGLGVELGVGDDLAGAGHDDGRLVRRGRQRRSPGTSPLLARAGRCERTVARAVRPVPFAPWRSPSDSPSWLPRPGDDLPLDQAALLIAEHAYGPSSTSNASWPGSTTSPPGARSPPSTGWWRTCSSTSASPATPPTTTTPATPTSIRSWPGAWASRSPWRCWPSSSGVGSACPSAGVGMPGHFLLRDRVDADVFVDPFVGGRLLDRGRVRGDLPRPARRRRALRRRFLDPVGPAVDRRPHAGQPAERVHLPRRPARRCCGCCGCARCCPTRRREDRAELRRMPGGHGSLR